jgi:hypothetical protein
MVSNSRLHSVEEEEMRECRSEKRESPCSSAKEKKRETEAEKGYRACRFVFSLLVERKSGHSQHRMLRHWSGPWMWDHFLSTSQPAVPAGAKFRPWSQRTQI